MSAARFDDLDDDVILQVFSSVSLNQRCRLETVCKRWQRLLISSYSSLKTLSLYEIAPSVVKLSDDTVATFFSRFGRNLCELHIDVAFRYFNLQFLNAVKVFSNQKLKTLTFDRVSVPKDGFKDLISSLTYLQTLSLITVNIESISEDDFVEIIEILPNLTQLMLLDQNCITGLICNVLPITLQTFTLGPNVLVENSLRAVADRCCTLKKLCLEGCKIHFEDLRYLCERMASLLYFNITIVELKNSQDQNCHLSIIGLLRNLRELHASQSTVCDITAKVLSMNCPNLTLLCLRSNVQLTDAGIVHLSSLNNLESVDFCDNVNVHDWSIGHLMLKCPKIRTVFVCKCKNIRGVFLHIAVRQCVQLRYVSLCECTLFDDDVLNECADYFEDRIRQNTSLVLKLNICKTKVTMANIFVNEKLQGLRLEFEENGCDDHHSCCSRYSYSSL